MIALDTNVLVRWIVEDDADQYAAAARLIERAALDDARLFVPTVVVAETVWVLSKVYGFTRQRIVESLSELASAQELQIEHAMEVAHALAAFSDGRGDFSDYLIRECAQTAGAQAVATFDRKLLGEAGFVDVDPAAWPDGLSLHEETPRYGRRRRRVSSPTRA